MNVSDEPTFDVHYEFSAGSVTVRDCVDSDGVRVTSPRVLEVAAWLALDIGTGSLSWARGRTGQVLWLANALLGEPCLAAPDDEEGKRVKEAALRLGYLQNALGEPKSKYRNPPDASGVSIGELLRPSIKNSLVYRTKMDQGDPWARVGVNVVSAVKRLTDGQEAPEDVALLESLEAAKWLPIVIRRAEPVKLNETLARRY